MDSLSILFILLTSLALFTILAMNLLPPMFSKETSTVEPFTSTPSTAIKVKAILDPMIGKNDLCGLYTTIREVGVKNEKSTSAQLSDSEALSRVEKTLAQNIPGGALPCPLLTYPSQNASDLQWLNWLQTLPDDFGARVVFMAMYAREYLAVQEKNLRDSLSGKNAPLEEPFQSICPPDVAQRKRSQTNSCILPEQSTPEQIQDLISKRLQTLVSTKSKVLSSKKIDPTIDIDPIVDQAVISKQYLDSTKTQVESGNLPF
jgi:hypothetical protein